MIISQVSYRTNGPLVYVLRFSFAIFAVNVHDVLFLKLEIVELIELATHSS